tara:strand:- start:92 stop:382 length:291 start_codon:yes stop_codon:yes gene_type:complete
MSSETVQCHKPDKALLLGTVLVSNAVIHNHPLSILWYYLPSANIDEIAAGNYRCLYAHEKIRNCQKQQHHDERGREGEREGGEYGHKVLKGVTFAE